MAQVVSSGKKEDKVREDRLNKLCEDMKQEQYWFDCSKRSAEINDGKAWAYKDVLERVGWCEPTFFKKRWKEHMEWIKRTVEGNATIATSYRNEQSQHALRVADLKLKIDLESQGIKTTD